MTPAVADSRLPTSSATGLTSGVGRSPPATAGRTHAALESEHDVIVDPADREGWIGYETVFLQGPVNLLLHMPTPPAGTDMTHKRADLDARRSTAIGVQPRFREEGIEVWQMGLVVARHRPSR